MNVFHQLLLISFVAIIIAFLSPKEPYITKELGKKVLTGKAQITLIILIFGVFIGLRIHMNDTGAYRWAYELMKPYPDVLSEMDWSLGANPGFILTNSILKALGFSTQSFIMFYSLIPIAMFITFIKKYSNDLPFSVYLFVTVGVYSFSAAAIKQVVATALATVAVSCALDKKWIKFFIVIFLAMTFHPYVLVYLAVPLLMFKPGTKYTFILLAVTIVVALSLNRLFGAINSFTEAFGDSYSDGSFSGEGVNIFRVLVCNMPTILSLVYRKKLFEDSHREENLIVNLTMMNGAIMIIGLFGTANYFARLANFFVIAQTLSIPWILSKIQTKEKHIIKAVALVGYALYFYYQSAIVLPFVKNFERIGLFEYLKTII